MKLSDVCVESRWFQGESGSQGRGRRIHGHSVEPMCLWIAACRVDGIPGWISTLEAETKTTVRLAAIIRRLFPERAAKAPASAVVIGFNNHPDTTWDQVAKVIHELEMEEDPA